MISTLRIAHYALRFDDLQRTIPGLPRGTRSPASLRPSRRPYLTALLVGLGGLFAGVTGPLLSTFVPILVRDALGDRRALIGAVMAIDNVLLLLLVPLAGVLSDRARASGGRRMPLLLAGLVLAAIGMAVFGTPWVVAAGLLWRAWWRQAGARLATLDGPGWLLAAAAAMLPDDRRDWGRP